eukprot:5622061-Pyramimonas_sp.AAC.1
MVQDSLRLCSRLVRKCLGGRTCSGCTVRGGSGHAYHRWADELGVGPTDLWVRDRHRGPSFNPQALTGHRASGDTGRSRVDDILLSRGE